MSNIFFYFHINSFNKISGDKKKIFLTKKRAYN